MGKLLFGVCERYVLMVHSTDRLCWKWRR